MDLPNERTHPLFSYGLFKPGELGYFRIEDVVQQTTEASTQGKLLERDGVPVLDGEGYSQVNGYLIEFHQGNEEAAYGEIVDLEPEKQYRWETRSISVGDDEKQANVLLGRNPTRGTTELEEYEWSGRDDPLFTDALELVEDVLKSETKFDWEDKKPFFRLQMAYLLLWSSIERYISLRYGLRGAQGQKSIHQKLLKMAEEPGFVEGLNSICLEDRPKTRITRADRPQDSEELDIEDPHGSIQYYYQVRSNLSHRGKTASIDFDILQYSLEELHSIFTYNVLPSAFQVGPE